MIVSGGSILTRNGYWLDSNESVIQPYPLPPKTLRFLLVNARIMGKHGAGERDCDGTWTRLYDGPDFQIYDYYHDTTDWTDEFYRNAYNEYFEESGDLKSSSVSVLDGNLEGVTSISGMLRSGSYTYATNVDALNVYSLRNTGSVVDTSNMFASSHLRYCCDLDTHNVTNMDGMFAGAPPLNYPYMDTSKITSTRSMFAGANDTSVANFPAYDFSNVEDMSYMFHDAKFTAAPDFDTSNAQNLSHMFQYCSNLTNLPTYDTSKAVNMAQMFYACDSLETVPLFDTHDVTDMSGMFASCDKLKTVPLFDTANVTDMSSMFGMSYTGSGVKPELTYVPTFDTSNVLSMAGMFMGCAKLTNMPAFNTSKVTSMLRMYEYCFGITTDIPLYDTSSCTNMDYMLHYVGNNRTLQGGYELYQQASSQASVPSHTGTFRVCTCANLNLIPSSWK